MKFDVKDIKSWANRHDVKVGDVGYVTCDFNTLLTNKVALATKATVKDIDNNDSRCFLAQPLNGKVIFHYGFFLPVDAVKEDKPKEKRYRPFKNLYEFYKFLSYFPIAKKEFFKDMLLKFSFTYRERNLPQCATTTMINRIDFDVIGDPCFCYINNRDFKDWFDNYEIMNNKGEWVPFGVGVKDEL